MSRVEVAVLGVATVGWVADATPVTRPSRLGVATGVEGLATPTFPRVPGLGPQIEVIEGNGCVATPRSGEVHSV